MRAAAYRLAFAAERAAMDTITLVNEAAGPMPA